MAEQTDDGSEPYEVVLTTEDERALREMHPIVREVVIHHLIQLENPINTNSRPSPVPQFRAGYMLLEFDCVHENTHHQFHLQWNFGPGEKSVRVADIGHVQHDLF